MGFNVETYVLIANASSFAGTAWVELMYQADPRGQACVSDVQAGCRDFRAVSVPANSRTTIAPAVHFPASAGRRYATYVTAIGDPRPELVVERAMYWNGPSHTVPWAAGTDALGIAMPTCRVECRIDDDCPGIPSGQCGGSSCGGDVYYCQPATIESACNRCVRAYFCSCYGMTPNSLDLRGLLK
jgi:hypothetical protein